MNPFSLSEKLRATILGVVAALFWSTSVAANRLLTETFGGMLTVAMVLFIAAVFSSVYLMLSKRTRQGITESSYKYKLGCGAFFIICFFTFYQALSLASSREQVVIVGIINYLWPALSLALSIPILKNRTNMPVLLLANAVALSGIVLAVVSTGGYSASGLIEALHSNYLPYFLALAAAVSWALYNNFSRLWGADGGAVPAFIIALAIIMSPVIMINFRSLHWSPEIAGILIFVAVFPTFLAYFFWDLAERKGHHTFINAMAYAIPLLSTLITCLSLSIKIPALTWLGCLLVIAGAVVSRLVIIENVDPEQSTETRPFV